MHLFTYGTLMHPEIWSSVVRGTYPSEEFSIMGYDRRALKDRAYPGLIKQEGASVKGVVYKGISETDMELLDHFEGDEYTRIEILKMNNIPVYTYLYTTSSNLVLNSLWDYDEFLKKNFNHFRNNFEGWKRK